tara:strand:- start:2878 stop:4305 length:1428 start_codon:yes stop_codon:yes gene_type:complete
MAIKKFFATKDNTITDGYGSVMTTRGTAANMGAADVLEVYSLYGAFATSSLEKSRFLVQFDTTDIATKRTDGDIPASGSTSFFLKLTNTPHEGTQATDFTLTINAVSRSWDEGVGLDMDEYLDRGVSNWKTASYDGTTNTAWTTEGGDYHTSPETTVDFTTGIEDLDVDVTDIVEQWLAGTKSNYGFFIKLSSSYESGEANTIASSSYYTKKFFARGSEYFFKRPSLDARWNSSKGDDRGSFYASSSLASSTDNLNTIYLYNNIRGQLTNVPGVDTGAIYVNYYETLGGTALNTTAVTGGWSETGIYTASAALTTTASSIYDVWFSGSTEYHTGSAITVKSFASDTYNPDSQYVVNVTNLQASYMTDSTTKDRIRLYIRKKGWSPTIYTTATAAIESEVVKKVYYSIKRVIDNLVVVPYGTGSAEETLMSYDVSGSYADVDFSNFEAGYQYEISFKLYLQSKYIEPKNTFRFRVG